MARGRPKKIIDKKTFEGLCSIQCTQAEICDVIECDEKTLSKWCVETYGSNFSQVFKQKRGLGKVSLRRAGFNMAKTNPSVHIFYAKNFLGMKDKIEDDGRSDILNKLDEVLANLGE